MDSAVIATLAGAIGGALIGGAASYLTGRIAAERQRDLDVERRILAKLEETHVAASRLAHQAGIAFAMIVGQLGAGRPFNKDELGGVIDTPRLSMLINFYTPALRPLADEMDSLWMELGRLMAESIGSRGSETKEEMVLRANRLNKAVSTCSDAIKLKLAEIAETFQPQTRTSRWQALRRRLVFWK